MFRLKYRFSKVLVRILGFFVGAILVLFLVTLGFLLSFYNVSLQTAPENACVVVFGASVLPNKTAASALQKRIKDGLSVSSLNNINCIIASGHKTAFDITEAEVIAETLKDLGYKDKVVLDKSAYDTYQALVNLDPNQSYVFVSSNYHLGRIYTIAKLKGFKDFEVYSGPVEDFFSFNHFRHLLREVPALWYNLAEFFIKHR